MVAAVDQGHGHRRAGEGARGGEPGETAADDDHLERRCVHEIEYRIDSPEWPCAQIMPSALSPLLAQAMTGAG